MICNEAHQEEPHEEITVAAVSALLMRGLLEMYENHHSSRKFTELEVHLLSCAYGVDPEGTGDDMVRFLNKWVTAVGMPPFECEDGCIHLPTEERWPFLGESA